MQMETEKSWGSNTYIRQNRLSKGDCNKRQRRTLHYANEIKPTRIYNCKHKYTQPMNM